MLCADGAMTYENSSSRISRILLTQVLATGIDVYDEA